MAASTLPLSALFSTLSFLFLTLFSSPVSAFVQDTGVGAHSIWEIIHGIDILEEFVNALRLTGLDLAVDDAGPITVFAPVNDALNALPSKMWEPAWRLHLSSLLLYHVIPLEQITTAEMDTVGEIFPTSLWGESISVTAVPPSSDLTLNGNARFDTEDIEARNGILHTVNTLLLPSFVNTNLAQALSSNPELSQFRTLLSENGLLGPITNLPGPYTVLAPNNAAFDKVPIRAILGSLGAEERYEILTYHILSDLFPAEDLLMEGNKVKTFQGNDMTIEARDDALLLDGGARIVTSNILVKNGIIHLTDFVLIPFLETMTPSTGLPAPTPGPQTVQPSLTPEPPTTVSPAPTPGPQTTQPSPTPEPPTTASPAPTPGPQTAQPSPTSESPTTISPAPMPGPQTTQPSPTPESPTTVSPAPTPGPQTAPPSATPEAPTTVSPALTPDPQTAPPSPAPEAPNTASPSPTPEPQTTPLPPTPITPLETGGTKTLSEVISSRNDTFFMSEALNASSFFGIWAGNQKRTVFCPTDSAFLAATSPIDFTLLLEPIWGRAHIWSLLKYHSIMGEIATKDMELGDVFTTFEGGNLTISMNSNNTIFVSGVEIQEADIEATNGNLHMINEILPPPWASYSSADLLLDSPEFATIAIIDEADLAMLLDDVGPFTLFAPTNEAFGNTTATHAKFLQYHLVPGVITRVAPGERYTTMRGSTIYITNRGALNATDGATSMAYNTPNGTTMVIMELGTFNDREATLTRNGIVHAIQSILIPSEDLTTVDTTPTDAPSPSPDNKDRNPPNNNGGNPGLPPQPNVLDLINESYDYTILASLIEKTDLVRTTLTLEGPFTVFAPNNTALYALPREQLFGLDDDTLVQTLLYHVVQGNHQLTDLADGTYEWETLQEGKIAVQKDGTLVTVMDDGGNTFEVVSFDRIGRNGVVHELGGVLQPFLYS